VCRGAIWWVLARWKPTWSDVGNTLAPSVSGSLRAKPGCGCGCGCV